MKHWILILRSQSISFWLRYQDSDYAKPRGLSVATLFGFQKDHQSSKPEPVSPLATPLETSSPGLVRPPVARTLTYEDASNTDRSVISTGGSVPVAGSPGELGGTVAGPSVTQHQPDEEQPQQHCPAFRKLLQGQRGVGGGVGVLQTVSESPENRLCDNGVPLEHHHHSHFPPHHQHHHHHHQTAQQQRPDPLERLFQSQPILPSSSSLNLATPLCCSIQQNVVCRPVTLTSVPCSHFRAQQSHQSCLEHSRPQTESLHNQSASAIQGKGASS